jgi:hypothetical protein
MNEEKFERIFLLLKNHRNENIKESKILKKDKFFKLIKNIFNGNYSEYYKILYYKYLSPNYILTNENLSNFKELRENVKEYSSNYMLYLIENDIYLLTKKLEISKINQITEIDF